MLILMLIPMLMLFAGSEWKKMSSHTHAHTSKHAIMSPVVVLRQMFCRRGRLIICTFCCKDLLSFYADKRFTHISKREFAENHPRVSGSRHFVSVFVSVVSFVCVLVRMCIMLMDMNVKLSHRGRHTLGQCNERNEVISVADLVIYHYFLMMPASCVIQYLLSAL